MTGTNAGYSSRQIRLLQEAKQELSLDLFDELEQLTSEWTRISDPKTATRIQSLLLHTELKDEFTRAFGLEKVNEEHYLPSPQDLFSRRISREGSPVISSMHVSLLDRSSEMSNLIKVNSSFFELVKKTCFAFRPEDFEQFLKLLTAEREELCDSEWMALISEQLKEPCLLVQFKEMVGFDFERVFVEWRDDPDPLVESKHPLFFSLVKQHIGQDYEQFVQVICTPRLLMSDQEWVDYIECILAKSTQLLRMFKSVFGIQSPNWFPDL